ncbi:MAG: homogentisate 1,2-dioxygenase [Granulosicoccus sp.]
MVLEYQSGFGNDFETEAVSGALPQGQNSPQNCAYGLYAEQLSGSAFTAPRGQNERSWLYRIRPSVLHTNRFEPLDCPLWQSAPHRGSSSLPLGQYRWDPIPPAAPATTFVFGVNTMTTAGDVQTQAGMAAHIYDFNKNDADTYLCNADGEMLFVPQQGDVHLFTELGCLSVSPGDIAVVPRGMMFRADCVNDTARGYLCENYGSPLTLPERGPIGANCLANPRDFKTPVAAFEDKEADCQVIYKWSGEFHGTRIGHSPLDVVAWHGNYAPYKYDLSTFSPVGAIAFDHPDPSIFTVLTSPTEQAGTANIDFVIFPPRWMVAENTFRPPWYHRNIMSEFMGLIKGAYDAKEKGFIPGGASLHNQMLPHGPDAFGFEKASAAKLEPVKLDNTLAFMFETRYAQKVTRYASQLEGLQDDYIDCWRDLQRRFPKQV